MGVVLQNTEPRFYCEREPNGKWAVWDRVADKPASLGGRDIVGCAIQRARAAEAVLERIYSNGLDAKGNRSPKKDSQCERCRRSNYGHRQKHMYAALAYDRTLSLI